MATSPEQKLAQRLARVERAKSRTAKTANQPETTRETKMATERMKKRGQLEDGAETIRELRDTIRNLQDKLSITTSDDNELEAKLLVANERIVKLESEMRKIDHVVREKTSQNEALQRAGGKVKKTTLETRFDHLCDALVDLNRRIVVLAGENARLKKELEDEDDDEEDDGDTEKFLEEMRRVTLACLDDKMTLEDVRWQLKRPTREFGERG